MIISGNKIARAICSELKEDIKMLSISMSLHIFIAGDDPVIENFVMKKKAFADSLGVEFIEHRFDKRVTQEDLITKIKQVSQGSPSSQMLQGTLGRFGMVVQLPLPDHIDTQVVLDAVPVEYDIDGLASESQFIEPVAGAVAEMIERKGIMISGKHALMIGSGKLVGVPVAKLLNRLRAEVTVANKETTHDELTKLCKESDLIVSGAGVPNLITPDMISHGVTLLDAGTSTQSGSVVGDIAYECKEKARYFARTPGGIGPVTVAVLFKNLISKKVEKVI